MGKYDFSLSHLLEKLLNFKSSRGKKSEERGS
jgi:hypothetical protein